MPAYNVEGARHAIRGYRASDGSAQPLRIDQMTDSIQVIDYAHHEIHGGSSFFVSGYVDQAINAVADLQITVPNTTKWAHWQLKLEAEKETLWRVYEGAVIVLAGTGLSEFNRNRNSSTSAGLAVALILNASLANANADTDVTTATLLDQGIVGAGQQQGGSLEHEHEIILKQNTIYTVRITATVAGFVNYRMEWYEHTSIA